MKPKVGLQLWTVREACEDDFFGTLKKVKEMGYEGVEFAGYYQKEATEVKAELDKLGLIAAGSHLGFDLIADNLDATMAYEKILGNNRLIVPYVDFATLEEWDNFFDELNQIQIQAEAAGFELYYHNHGHEFTKIPGIDLLDRLTKKAPKIKLEVDLYWVTFAGIDALQWVKDHQSQVGLFHIKDYDPIKRESTELGAGNLPLAESVECAEQLNMPWVVVEQEAFSNHTPLAAAAIDCQVLTQLVKGEVTE